MNVTFSESLTIRVKIVGFDTSVSEFFFLTNLFTCLFISFKELKKRHKENSPIHTFLKIAKIVRIGPGQSQD